MWVPILSPSVDDRVGARIPPTAKTGQRPLAYGLACSTRLHAIKYQAQRQVVGIMPDAQNHRSSERVRLDLIEADVDMAFGLVDDARDEFREGNQIYAQRALEDARRALADIETRLRELGSDRSSPFGPPVEELRKFINEAEAECA